MSVLPPPPAVKPRPRDALPLVSLLAVLLLLFAPARRLPARTLAHPSLFSAREGRRAYARPRAFASYAHGRACSPPARAHFLRRLHRAGRPLAPRRPPAVAASANRVLLSAVPSEVGDGLGHRTCILNYELHMALALGVSYAHRKSTYGSLTRADPDAIEQLFGWGGGELTRERVLGDGCLDVGFVNDTCEIPAQNVVCRRVRPRGKGGLFDQTVVIPDAVADCFLQRGPDASMVDQLCYPLVKSFTAAYSEPNTLFQMRPNRCFREYLYTNFSTTADWFADKYWSRLQSDASVGGRRQVSLDSERIHIAMHVRRGDFFNYTNRVLIPDATYADVAWRVIHALDEMVGGEVPVSVHVFSEGVANRTKDNHDTATMAPVYIDERGRPRDAGHWGRLMGGHRRGSTARARAVETRVYVASDTVAAVHTMLAADVFVGSASGLSVQVVRYLGRGVMVLPVWEGEVGDEPHVVPFDWARNGFDSFVREEVLYAALARGVRRNRLGCSVW